MHYLCIWIYCNISFVYFKFKIVLELDAFHSDKTTYFHSKLGWRVQIVTKSTEETVKVCDFRPLSMPYLDDRGKPSDSRVYSNLHLSIITKNRLRATLDKVLRGISQTVIWGTLQSGIRELLKGRALQIQSSRILWQFVVAIFGLKFFSWN